MREGKSSGALDAFLNVLLFAPFGFGLAEKLREKGKLRAATLASVWVTGALFSYTIEVLQIYVPSRDSGWGDVITNSSGSVVGYLGYELYGKWVLGILGEIENVLRSFLRPRTAALLLLAYFGIWFAASYQLQTTTRLRGWDPNPILVLGNDTWNRPWQAWKGRVLSLAIWDRAIPDQAAIALTSKATDAAAVDSPIAAYGPSPRLLQQDSMKFFPALAWRPAVGPQVQAESLALQGQAWLVSEEPAPQLVARLEKSNRFSVQITCIPGTSGEPDGRIVSIGHPAAPGDLTVRQKGPSLVFWFHTPLSARHAQLAWTVPGVFTTAGQARDILYTYDGSSLSLFLDGKKEERPFRLGAGPALARSVRRIKPGELEGYSDIYYALIFFPAGIVLGLAARKTGGPGESSGTADWLLLGALLIVAPWLLEILLVRAGSRPFLAGEADLSLAFFVAGALWINAGLSPMKKA